MDAAGTGYVFASAAEAAAVVGFLRERGIASIDVGCFQVNLQHHPAAFGSLAAGFDPALNADYAARFLRSLYDRTGNWDLAVGEYHSADPALAGPYREKVHRAWLRPGETAADPHVLLAAADLRPIPVYTPRTLPNWLRRTLGLSPARASAGGKPYLN